MSVLYSEGNIALNQQGSTVSFSATTLGLNSVSLLLSSDASWTQTANHSVYNVIYIDGGEIKGLDFGPADPLILVIEKATDSSNNLLKIHEFELS